MEDKIVTIVTYNNLQKCYIVQSKLEAEGIEVFIYDDNFASIVPGISGAIGGNRLCVKTSQAKTAMAILKAINLYNKEMKEKNELWVRNKHYEKSYGECPKCESENIFSEKLSTLKSLFSGFWKIEHYCKDCGHSWFQIAEKI